MEVRTKPWMVLGGVACAQLMIGVDATILAVALPELVQDLRLDDTVAAWVMAGYVLASGSLMIPAGRVAQSVGYARLMSLGLLGFGIASVTAGLASEPATLVAARVGQGVAAAAITPAAMARLSAAFADERRPRAYGIFGTVMGAGTAIGLTLGGVLTQLGGWRACMFVNVAFVMVSLACSYAAHDQSRGEASHAQGAWRGLLVAAGVGSLIQAMMTVKYPATAALWLFVALLVLFGFGWLDRGSSCPLVPAALLAAPQRRAAYVALLVWGIATIAAFVSVSKSLQIAHRLAPLTVGLLVLVYPAAIQAGLFLARRLPKPVSSQGMGLGLALIAVGQAILALAPPAVPVSLAALAAMGLGTSQVMPTANSEMNRDAGQHSGVAGGLGSTLQQLGASTGLALPLALAPLGFNPSRAASALTASALIAAALALLTTRTANTSKEATR